MSENQSPQKVGRKQQHYKASNGEYINGLQYDEKSKRWRIIGTQKRFRAANEAEALAKFYSLTKQGEGVFENLTVEESDAIDETEKLLSYYLAEVTDGSVSFDEWKARQSKFNFATEAEFWKFTAEQIINFPKLCAEKTGIEKLAYLTDLKPPKPLPTFEELETLWNKYAKCSGEQKQKVKRAWLDFVDSTEIKSLDEITPEIAIEFMDIVHERPISTKQESHIFGGVRRMLTSARDRAICVDEMNKFISYVNLMKPSGSTANKKPKPISKENWTKIYQAAEDREKAMILLMLNGAFGISEVIRLRWDDIENGAIVTNRHKKGLVIRACYLLEETKAALAKLPKSDGVILRNYQGDKFHRSGATEAFKKVCEAAKIAGVTGSHLRDGSQTAAAQGGVNEQLIKVLAGHQTGMSDHYIAVTPELTKSAVDAIHKYYFE